MINTYGSETKIASDKDFDRDKSINTINMYFIKSTNGIQCLTLNNLQF